MAQLKESTCVLLFVKLINIFGRNKFVTFDVCRNNQFAVVENPGFWNWTFTVKDADGEVLAQIDRDWRGFGFEVCVL